METALLIALEDSKSNESWDIVCMLKRAADKLGLRVCGAEVCSRGQSELVYHLAPGDHILVSNTDVVGDQEQLQKLLTTCYYGAMTFILVNAEEEMYELLPSLIPDDYSVEIVDINV